MLQFQFRDYHLSCPCGHSNYAYKLPSRSLQPAGTESDQMSHLDAAEFGESKLGVLFTAVGVRLVPLFTSVVMQDPLPDSRGYWNMSAPIFTIATNPTLLLRPPQLALLLPPTASSTRTLHRTTGILNRTGGGGVGRGRKR